MRFSDSVRDLGQFFPKRVVIIILKYTLNLQQLTVNLHFNLYKYTLNIHIYELRVEPRPIPMFYDIAGDFGGQGEGRGLTETTAGDQL